jgi:hypothetical protein
MEKEPAQQVVDDAMAQVPEGFGTVHVIMPEYKIPSFDPTEDYTVNGDTSSSHSEKLGAIFRIARAALRGERDRMREANGILEDALQEVGDDYPGSSCQEWCQQQVRAARWRDVAGELAKMLKLSRATCLMDCGPVQAESWNDPRIETALTRFKQENSQ